jgi:acyl-CoA thioesterase
MEEKDLSKESKIVSQMMEKDAFSRWMGVEIIDVKEGYCKISCKVKDEMLNGYKVTHGGIVFSLADSALAFSAATFGRVSLAIDNSISLIKKTTTGDTLIATSTCMNLTYKTGIFEVKVTNSDDDLIALMKATVYRTGEEFQV